MKDNVRPVFEAADYGRVNGRKAGQPGAASLAIGLDEAGEAVIRLREGETSLTLPLHQAADMAALDEQIKTLQHELLATADMKNPGDDLGMEVRRLRNEKQALRAEEASHQDLKLRIDEMMTFLDCLSSELNEYDEQYTRTLIDKITVYDDHFIVEFKSGIEIQIDE